MKQLKLKLFKTLQLRKLLKCLKVQKQLINLVSEDGSTELLTKGAEITEEVLKIPFELIGYLPLEARA